MKMKLPKKPTWTFLVQETLQIMDEMLTQRQLMDLTGGNVNQISAAVSHLLEKRVIGGMIIQNVPHFYLTGDDDRTYTRAESTPEEKGSRKQRKSPNVQGRGRLRKLPVQELPGDLWPIAASIHGGRQV